MPSASLAKPISRSSNGIGGIDHRCFISTVQPNSSAALLGTPRRPLQHRGELVGVEVALVEQHLGAARDRRHHARVAGRAAGGAVPPSWREPDLADQRARRAPRPGTSPPHVHRRRARVGRAAAEHGGAALDADRAEHDRGRARRAPRAPGPARCAARGRRARPSGWAPDVGTFVEVDVVAGDDVLEPLALAVLEVAHLVDVERAGAGRGAEQAAAEARALLVGPVDEAQPDRRRVAVGVRAQRPRARRASPSAPSSQPPAGTESTCEPTITKPSCSPGRSAQTLPASSRSISTGSSSSLRAHQLARLHPLVGPARRGGRRPAPPVQLGELAQVGDDAVGVDHERDGGRARPSERGTKRPWPGRVRISPRS